VLLLSLVGQAMDSKPHDSNPEVTVERDDEVLKVGRERSMISVIGTSLEIMKGCTELLLM
jgi:hypothetical protein